MIYLDNSATTRVFDDAAAVALHYMTKEHCNPSSMYIPAVEVERAINGARERLGAALGANSQEIVYTSGGTESNNIALLGTTALLRRNVKWRIITSAIEHPSVYEVFLALENAGFEVIRLNVDAMGRISLQELDSAINEYTALVSIMHVNNEVGSIADLDAIGRIIKRKNPNTLFHSDGVQAFCKFPYGPVPVDLYSLSGHKFHAPKGVGALMMRGGVRSAGGLIGGGQERGLRSGTTNSSGIMAMDMAMHQMRINQAALTDNMRKCKVRLYENLSSIEDVIVNGPAPQEGAPHILNMSFLGVRGEVLLHALEEKGIYVSTGSACSAHKRGKNRVLEAMGIPIYRAEGAIRFSLCCMNTLIEMDDAATAISELVPVLRRFKKR